MKHGNDPFRWLEDTTSSATRTWLLAQQELITRHLLNHALRNRLRHQVERVLSKTCVGVPVAVGGRLYFLKRDANQLQSALYARRSPRGCDQLLFDPCECNNKYFSVELFGASPDGDRVAVGTREGGVDGFSRSLILNANSNSVFDCRELDRLLLARVSYDLRGVFFFKPEPGPPTIQYAPLDDLSSSRPIALSPVMEPSHCYFQPMDAGRWLLLIQWQQSPQCVSAWAIDCASGSSMLLISEFRSTFCLRGFGSQLYLLTDSHAPRKRVLRATLQANQDIVWTEVIAESSNVIQDLAIVGGKLITTEIDGSSTRIRVRDSNGNTLFEPDLPEGVTVGLVKGHSDGVVAAYEFSSPAWPPTSRLLDTVSLKESDWFKEQSVPDLEAVVTEYKTCYASDGTCLPVTLFYRGDLSQARPIAALLTAYGGFGVPFTPRYSNRAAAWLSMGGLYAVATIRGGGEFGQTWHEAGRKRRKQTSFSDFIAVAEWLISTGYAQPDKLAIAGGSNGGLLVGAALTQRPDLFGAVICFGPFLDMLRYHLYPGGAIGREEYGNPEDTDDYACLLRYSPYHNVKDGVLYPPTLFISGDADTRCDPMHARKMTARLQASRSARHPILLDYHTQRGHAALLPLDERMETLTNQFCFLSTALGLTLDQDGLFVAATVK